ncbi:MAG TPA: transcriptional repressor [Geminicoccaceae bacterium]|nr:transcriptional repressor [Geminicoccaceae bacterium]
MPISVRTAGRGAAPDHDHERCVDDALGRAATLCARRGARLTDLRRRVLELVWQGHEAVKAYDVLERLGSAPGAAKPPTVYRALDFLMAHGLVHRLESLNAYVGCPRPERSHKGRFLICDACGHVAEFDSAALRAAIADEAQEVGFGVRDETVEVRGVCWRCQTAPPAAT